MTRRMAFGMMRSRQRGAAKRGGFTLVELLVVIAIIAMLMGLLIPAVQRAREAGRRAQCMNNQQQLGKAMVGYASAKERMPPGFSIHPATVTNPPASMICMGWVIPMLPYMEQNALYQQIQMTPLLVNTTSPTIKPEVSTLVCPSRGAVDNIVGYAPLSYVVNAGMQDNFASAGPNLPLDWQENGVFFDNFTPIQQPTKGPRVTTDLGYITKHDGTAMTTLLSENLIAQDWMGYTVPPGTAAAYTPVGPYPAPGNTWWQGIVWYVDPGAGETWNLPSYLNHAAPIIAGSDDIQPTGPPALGLAKPSSNHPGGFLMTMCDGHTVFLSEDVEYRVYALVMAPNSGDAKLPGVSPATPPYVMSPPAVVGTPGAWKDSTGGLIPIFEADLTR